MVKSDVRVPENSFSLGARKSLLVDDEGYAISSAHPFPVSIADAKVIIDGDVAVDVSAFQDAGGNDRNALVDVDDKIVLSSTSMTEVYGTVNVNNIAGGTVSVDNFPGTYDVGNFPSVYDVVGSVDVLNFPTSQNIHGTVSVDNIVIGTVSIDNYPTDYNVYGTVDIGNLSDILDEVNLNAVTVDTDGASISTHLYGNKTVYVSVSANTGAVTVNIETSPDGTNWYIFDSKTYTAETSNDSWEIKSYFPFMRTTVTSLTDATVTTTITGRGI